jgi:hypothetical protein
MGAYKQFYGLKILKFFDADPNPGSFGPWKRDGNIRTRDHEQTSWIRKTATEPVESGYETLVYTHIAKRDPVFFFHGALEIQRSGSLIKLSIFRERITIFLLQRMIPFGLSF